VVYSHVCHRSLEFFVIIIDDTMDYLTELVTVMFYKNEHADEMPFL
jgi:hypothetical protein